MALPGWLTSLLGRAGSEAVGFAVGGAVAPAIQPDIQPLINEAWALAPNMPTPAQVAAQKAVKDPRLADTMRDQAAQQGFGAVAWDAFIDSVNTPPGIAMLLDLYNRGKLTAEQVVAGFRGLLIEDEWLQPLLNLAVTPLSPAEAATARQQGFLNEAEQAAAAALSGVDAQTAQIQFEINGLPPGVETALVMYRRGRIDAQTFAQIVAEGHTKTKYTDDLLSLADTPLSPSVAAEAVVRERTLPRDPHDYARAAGLSPEDFDAWVQMLGRPIAQGEALTVINRGLKGDPNGAEAHAYFREAVARSDIRTEYADDLYALRIHYPPLFQVQRALQAGTITKEVAADTLRKEGYPPEWVSAVIDSHPNAAKVKAKDLSASIIDTLYTAGLEDHEQAAAALQKLGYDAQEAAEYLEVWAARRLVSELVHGVTVVRSRYTGWRISATETRADLVALGIDDTTIGRLLTWWLRERQANAPALTTAEIAAGFHYGRYDYATAEQMLLVRGWTHDDALTILWVREHGDPRPGAVTTTTPPTPTTPASPPPA